MISLIKDRTGDTVAVLNKCDRCGDADHGGEYERLLADAGIRTLRVSALTERGWSNLQTKCAGFAVRTNTRVRARSR